MTTSKQKTPLQKKAMLFSLNIAVWGTEKKDRAITMKVLKEKKAAASAGRFQKNLMPGNQFLHEIDKLKGLARNYSRLKTLPWSDQGPRILPSALFNEHKKYMTQMKAKFDTLVKKFLKSYEAAKDDAKAKLGDMYEEGQYPTIESLKRRFIFEFNYEAITDAADFRVDIGVEEIQKIQASMRTKQATNMRDARKELLTRFKKAVENAATTLGDTDKNRFHSTLTTNLADLAKDGEALNLDGDPILKEIIEESAEIGSHDAQELKKNPEKREEVADASEATLKKIKEQLEGLVI